MSVQHVRRYACIAIGLCLCNLAPLNAAQSGAKDAALAYPSKPVRLIIPFPPGGSNDIVGRYVAAQLTEWFGRQVIVDNRAGADGIIGSEIAARSEPDGHTLLVISTAFPMNAAIHKLPYDSMRSFTWISILGSGPTILAAFSNLQASSVKDIVALGKAKRGELLYASSGIGGFNHFAAELFRNLSGVDMVHIPYKGGGPAIIGVISGQAHIIFASTVLSLPHIRSGKLKALGTGGTKRSAVLPDIPTIAEGGVTGYDASNWWGVLGPAGMPSNIVHRLNQIIGTIMSLPETRKRFATEGAEPMTLTPHAFGKLIVAEIAKWKQVAMESGIRAD